MYISLTRFQSRFRRAPTISYVLEYCADKEKRHSAELIIFNESNAINKNRPNQIHIVDLDIRRRLILFNKKL